MAELSKVEAMSFEIDPVKYGVLWQKVENYEAKFDDMSKKIDKMEASIEELVGMANRSRGGLWVGMGVVSVISSVVGFIAHWLGNK
jgi:flagellar hook assembly protein FlgD